eukprot:TRINITY_DN4027_c0_g2_i1.p1 TRINITY_DN4027_c0_g2~~TRINITY_DN4027_c0_g2_i1.p1  ORF type:complete len:273 (-),score=56.19 TRINITY_DN4027_c0_g2_i1:251-1036(-)
MIGRGLALVVLCFFLPALVFSQADRTRLRVVHTIPNGPSVDIYANDMATNIKGLGYSEASEYVTLPAGIWDITATVAGCTDQLVKTQAFELVSRASYSLLLVRDYTTGAAAYVLKVDDNTLPREMAAAVRFIHASPVTPTFPITVQANGKPVFANYNYGQASPYQVFPAGTYNFTFTITTPVTTVLTTVYDVSLSSRSVYTLWALGLERITATLSEDMGAHVPDLCADCPCQSPNAFSTSSQLDFVFDGMVPGQTACCRGK